MAKKKTGEKKEKILKATIKLVSHNGFYNVNIPAIAHEAGIAVGTIYIYFKKKDDILLAIFHRFISETLETIKESLTQIDDPIQKLSFLIKEHVQLFVNEQDLGRLFLIELRQNTNIFKEAANEVVKNYIQLIKDVISIGVEKGVFKVRSLTTTAHAIFGMIDNFLVRILIMEEKFNPMQEVNELINFMLEGLIRKEGR